MIKAVILIHGFLTNSHDFDNIRGLLKINYDLIEDVKIPGHGDTPVFLDFDSNETFVSLKASYNKIFKMADVIDVIGFSMGGALASYLASNYKINRLVLLAPANRYINPNLFFSYIKTTIKFLLGKNSSDKKTKQENQENLKIFMENNSRGFDFAIHQFLPNTNDHTLTTFFKIIKTCNKGLKDFIDVPTLIMWGELDQLVPAKTVVFLKQKLTNPDSKVIIFPDISHLMLFSANNQKLIDEIVAFLNLCLS